MHIPYKPTYTPHPFFPVRRMRWRAGYKCKVAVVLNDEFEEVSGSAFSNAGGGGGSREQGWCQERGRGDVVEIWGVRKGWITKWAVGGSAGEVGVAGECSLLYLSSPFTHLI